jgi:hypothetical protein
MPITARIVTITAAITTPSTHLTTSFARVCIHGGAEM